MKLNDKVIVKATRDKERPGIIEEFVGPRTLGIRFDAAENLAYFDKDRVEVITQDTPQDITTSTTGIKYDSGKNRLELVPVTGIEAAGRAFTFGAKKYADHNWAKGMDWDRLIGSAMRHITAWSKGQDKDPESGLSHLDHSLACLMMLSAYEQEGIGNDNRRKTIR